MKHQITYFLLLFLLCSGCSTSQSVSKKAPPVMAPVLDENTPLSANEELPEENSEELAESDRQAREADKVVNEELDHGKGKLKPVTLTFKKVAQGLGIPERNLASQSRSLARFIKQGRAARSDCDADKYDDREKLCELMLEYRRHTYARSYASSDGRRVPVRPQYFRVQQSFGYERLLKSIHREPAQRILAWAPKLLATTSCPRNLSAAALRRLESLLPNSSAQRMMNKLYAHAAACLGPEEAGFEVTHLRMGLLKKMWGDEKGAKLALMRAALAKNSSEKTRSLFWAGLLQNSPRARDRYWNELTREYPLSFHALEAWRLRKVDPMKIFLARPDIQISTRAINQNPLVDESLRWLESLYLVGEVEAAQRFSRWMGHHFKEDLTPANRLYISLLKSARGTPLNTITFMTRQVSENPDIINEQTLRILFPRPYLKVFDKASPKTDTHLILAVARQESGFNPRARSHANAQGLLQILPSTARLLSGRRSNNLYDTETNAKLGVKFLSQLIDRFGSVEHALAGYNAGPGRVVEWRTRYPTNNALLFMDLIPFNETRNYVSAILRNNYWYERIYADQSPNQAKRILASISGTEPIQKSLLVSKLVRSHLSAQAHAASDTGLIKSSKTDAANEAF